MNINDIAEFLDLVKNPAKYQKFVDQIKGEQERLNTAIELVGKASEIDKIRKEIDKEKETVSAKVKDTEANLNARISATKEEVAKMYKEAEELKAKAGIELAEAKEAKKQAKLAQADAQKKQVEVAAALDRVTVKESELRAKLDELAIKQEQLKNILGG